MKGSKKILSLGLAVAMAFSVGASAFAASAAENEPVYTPTYNDRVTEEKVEELITMADGALDSMVWANYGGTVVNAIYGVLPQLSMLAPEFGTVALYQQLDADLFADLTAAEGETEVTAESMAAYLETHTAAVTTAQELSSTFETLIRTVLEKVLPAPLDNLIPLLQGNKAGALLYMIDYMAPGVFAGLDDLIVALGADRGEQTPTQIITSMIDVESGTLKEDISQAVDALTNYLMSIVDLLIPNTVDKLLTLIDTYAENQAAIVAAVNKILGETGLGSETLSSILGFAGIDIAPTVSWINGAMAAYTQEDGTLDLDGVVNTILDGATGAFGGLVDIPDLSTFVFVTTEGAENTAMIKLSSVNDLIASIAAEGCDSSADVLMVAYNYVYDNLLGDEANKTTLLNLINLLPSLLPNLGLDQGTIDMINGILPSIPGMIDELTANGPLGLLDTVMVMLGILEDPNAGTPTDPTQPSEGDGNTTDTENPATGDAALGAVVMIGTAAAAAVVLLRRKK